ncbi:MAG: hypothetical protein K1X79_07655 [Oligoflexia bacterium]|nr:hypothetical protein [Oligoflexia bacterium]
MKRLTPILLAALVATSIANVPAQSALADSKAKLNFAAARLKQIDQLTDQLAKVLKKLSPAQIDALIAKVKKLKMADSDDDGLPDIVDKGIGGDACDADSDHDGLDDGDELADGKDPTNPDSDGDGNGDADELDPAKGRITAIDSSHIEIPSSGFSIVEATKFENKDGDQISIEDFAINDCVRIEGHKVGDANVADEIKKASNCD